MFSHVGGDHRGTNVVYHAAGWLEGGLCASYEKFIMDCEVLQMFQSYLPAMEVNDGTLAFDAIKEVGPHGHFFGIQHTQDRYETAFYTPVPVRLVELRKLARQGAVWTAERANTMWKQILAEFEPRRWTRRSRKSSQAFVAKRKEEGGAPTDF